VWADNLTPEKIRKMSETEIRSILKQVLNRVKLMPDLMLCKKQMVELGKIALKINEYGIQLEKAISDEEKENIQNEILKLHNKAVELIAIVVAMQKDPLSFVERIVEVQEETYEDPWEDSIPKKQEDINTINQDFDPWKTNEF
jgi:tRNA A22 N-methylase